MSLRAYRLGQAQGLLHWMLPLVLGTIALTTLLSGRDYSQPYSDVPDPTELLRPAAMAWLQRGASLLLVLIAAERIAHHFAARTPVPSRLLAAAFITYWFASVASPAFFGAHPQVSHEYLYPLFMGVAALLATPDERDRVVDGARNALLLFLLAGVALAGLVPSLVLDLQYRRGLVPGLPRFAGLAPHAVGLGMLAQTFLLCLWARPYRGRGWNAAAWALGLGVVLLAQSKNAWVSLLLCALAMLAVRHGPSAWRRVGDPRDPSFGIVACTATIALVLAVLGPLLVGDVGARAADFLDTREGASLMTMSGRDRIWAIALEEWHASPVFGYGPGIWDADFQASIRMANATSGHNQLMDTLSRSGLVGTTALVAYAAVLLFLCARAAKATGGLGLALGVALALRAMSEVPLLLLGYGMEIFAHLLLVVILAAASARPAMSPASPRRAAHAVPSP